MASDISKDEFHQEALSFLEELGVTDAEVGEPGEIPLESQPPAEPEVLEEHIVDVTDTKTEILNDYSLGAFVSEGLNDYINPTTSGGPPLRCAFLPCWWLELRGIECTTIERKWLNPELAANTMPLEYPNVTARFNPLNPRITGEVTFELKNESELGKECERTKYKCKPDGEWSCQPIQGSATIDSEDDGNLVSTVINETIDSFQSVFESTPTNETNTVTLEFEKQGALDLLKSLINIFITGKMTSRQSSILTATTMFRGERITKEFSIDKTVEVPVRNVNYGW